MKKYTLIYADPPGYTGTKPQMVIAVPVLNIRL